MNRIEAVTIALFLSLAAVAMWAMAIVSIGRGEVVGFAVAILAIVLTALIIWWWKSIVTLGDHDD